MGPLQTLTLDQLIALNDEMAALVRAGVPLESGLGQLGHDLPGQLGARAEAIATEMKQGRPLAEALKDPKIAMPPVYLAAVEAGLRSGRLSGALESVAHTAQRLVDSRRLVAASLLYPLVLFLVAWMLFVLFLVGFLPQYVPVLEDFQALGARPLGALAGWGESAVYWGPAVPAFVLLAAGLWWWRATRASLVAPPAAGRWFGWLPGIGGVLRSFQAAAFAEVLAMLVESQTPLAEALDLAAAVSGDRRITPAAHTAARQIEAGQPIDLAAPTAGLPPLVRWMMISGSRRGTLALALRHAAEAYHRRAVHRARNAAMFLPVVATVAIGGSLTLVYILILFGPWIAMLHALMSLA